MKTSRYDRLLRLLDGELSPEDEIRLLAELERSPALRAQREDVRTVRTLLQSTMADPDIEPLRPFFTDRLMRRLRPSPDEALFGSLWHLFRPVAIASLLLIVSLASYTATRTDAWDVKPTTAEAILGLEPVTLTAAYTSDLDPFADLDP